MAASPEILELAASLNAIVWEADSQTLRFTYVSPKAEALLGYPARQWIEEPDFWVSHLHPEDRDEAARFCRAATDAGRDHVFEYRFLAADGRWLWLRDIVRVTVGDNALPNGLHGVLFDVTEQKRLQEALAVSDEMLLRTDSQYQAMIVNSTDLVSILEADGGVRYASPSHEAIVGWSPAELVGRNAFDLVHPDDLPPLLETFAASIGIPGSAAQAEFRYRHKDGSWRVLEGRARSMLHDPAIGGAVINLRDVTERKRSEVTLRALLDVTRQLSGTLDLEEMLGRVQPTLASLLDCDMVSIYHVEESTGRLTLAARHGAPGDERELGSESTAQGGHLLLERLRTGEPAVAEGSEQPWFRAEDVDRFGAGPFVIAPLLVQGALRGMACAARRKGSRPFEATEVALFEGLARQISLALHGAELYRTQEREATVASALVRVGKELISSLDQPVLLERVSRLTTEVLGCDFSHTYLLDREDQALVIVGGFGDHTEEREALRGLRLPWSRVGAVLERLDVEGVVQMDAERPGDLFPGLRKWRDRVRWVAFVALRRGEELVGVLSAGWRDRVPKLSREQLRITEGLGQLASLALANTRVVEELERLNRLKSDFVATMSHELRTPLNVIMGYNDLLLDGSFGPLLDQQGGALVRVQRSARELLELINATLDLSRLDAGGSPVELGAVDLTALLRAVELETRDLCTNPRIQVVWERDETVPPLFSDEVKLKVILKNLVSNALKFTDEGTVTVTTRATGDGIEIAVCDTGVGIPPEAQALVFESFRQVDSGSTRRHGGVGLGLYIVNRLLELLGGTIKLESEPGRGSTFRVLLPAQPPAASPEPASTALTPPST